MKKIILVLATIFSFGVANAQVDVITKHSGETVEGKVIRIYGNDTLNVDLTIATVAGEIEVGGTAVVLGASTHYLELVSVGGVWFKTAAVTS